MFFALFQGFFCYNSIILKIQSKEKTTLVGLTNAEVIVFKKKNTAKKNKNFIHVLLWHNLGCLAVEVSFIIGVALFANSLCQ